MNSSEETIPEADLTGERLMAYLDQEMPPAARKQFEDQLSTDSELRQRMKDYQQTWDLLDELPRDHVDDDFTRITVEMVAVHAEGEAARKARMIARWRMAGLGLGLTAAVVAGLVGYSLTSSSLSAANRQLVEDLPILQQLDAYQSAGSIEFLRTLESEGLFLEEGDESHAN